MRILELYAGIGGMHYALEGSGINGTVVAAVEISTVANDVYKHNFPSTKLLNRNVQSLTVKEIESMNVDAIFMSPPCQPFTNNGIRRDAADPRITSFFHVLKLIAQLSNLKYILLENVEPFKGSASYQLLISCLRLNNFNYNECILSPSHFGVPNSRSRYYLIAKRNTIPIISCDPVESSVTSDCIIEILSESQLYRDMQRKYGYISTKSPPLSEFIDSDVDVDIHGNQYNLPITMLAKYSKVLDIRHSLSKGSCCFTSAYGRYMEGTGSVFSPLPKMEIDEKLAKLKNNDILQSKESNELLLSLGLRHFTPNEISRIMCFPRHFSFPNSINKRQQYKLIGNSINVYVVSHLILLLNHLPVGSNISL